MEQYISKTAVMTEIEKLRGKISDGSSYYNGWQHALRMLEIELNTLIEVKEVDLDLEITLWANVIPEMRLDDVKRLAKYFFELGIKVQKGNKKLFSYD